jgi:methyl-accepting chemotaxis protein
MANNVGSSTTDMRAAADDMTKMMQEAGTSLKEVAAKITEALEQTTGRMAASTERATQQFEGASERSANHIEEALGSIISRLTSETKGLGADVAKATIAAGDDSRKQIINAGSEVADTLSGINLTLSQAVEQMRVALHKVSSEMVEAERGIAAHAASLSQLVQATRETQVAMTGAAHSMREAGSPLAESSRSIAEATRSISDATGNAERSIASAQAQIVNIGQLLESTLQVTTQQWSDYEHRFKNVDDSLGLVLDRIVQNVRDNVEILGTFVRTFDEKVSSAVDKLGGGIDELGEFAQAMEKATFRVNGGSHHNA